MNIKTKVELYKIAVSAHSEACGMYYGCMQRIKESLDKPLRTKFWFACASINMCIMQMTSKWITNIGAKLETVNNFRN